MFRPVAIKFFKGNQRLLERELFYLKLLRGVSNVIEIYGTYEEPGGKGIVMELMSYNLKQVIQTETYGIMEMYNWFYQVSLVLSYLHEMGHLHRDVKPSNLLLDASWNKIKLIDFGIARYSGYVDPTVADEEMWSEKIRDYGLTRIPSVRGGTKAYMAPEIFDGIDNYACSADVYSFGITILVTATKQSVWSDEAWNQGKQKIGPALKIAVNKMLQKDSFKRPSMRKLHAFFEKLKFKNVCDEDLLEPEEFYSEVSLNEELFRTQKRLDRKHNIDLPCYGPEDFQDEEMPPNPCESTSETGKNWPVLSMNYSDLTVIRHLSHGSFGYLSLVETKLFGQVVLKLNWSDRNKVGKKAAAEVLQSRELVAMVSISQHPNIVRFYGIVKDKTDLKPIGFLMEYMSNGSIREYYDYVGEKNVYLSTDLLHNWVLQIANAISFLHNHAIIHRDINPNNILLSGDLHTVKLGDFGLARYNTDDESLTFCVGTQDFAAPEIIEGGVYSFSVDIWSFGATIAFIFSVKDTRRMPRKELCMHKVADKNRTCFPLLYGSKDDKELDRRIIDLIIRCCAHKPSLRPTAIETVDAIRDIIASSEGKINPDRPYIRRFWRDAIDSLLNFVFHY